mmetsp:Transcript_15514/g.36862  ORF Transcript_15514/g.36862 Transcript_15514/m.36862 type:complete len:669 (+) Transcript_15514:211-2217(+)
MSWFSSPKRMSISDNGTSDFFRGPYRDLSDAGSVPGEDTYLRFSLNELGSTVGVRADELVQALQKHAQPADEGTRTSSVAVSIPGTPGGRASVTGVSTPVSAAAPYPTSSPLEDAISRYLLLVQPEEQEPSGYQEEGVSDGEAAPAPLQDSSCLLSGEHLPISNLIDDMAMQAGLDELGTEPCTDLDDLEAPLMDRAPSAPLTMSDVISDLSGAEEPHGFFIKVVDRGVPIWERAGTAVTGESIQDILECRIGDEIREGAHGEQLPDTYVLALPETGVEPDVGIKALTLPSDISDVVVRAQPIEDAAGEKHTGVQITVSRTAPVLGYFLLVLAVWGVSTLGAGFRMLSPADPYMKATWRSTLALLVLTPWTAANLFSNYRCLYSLRDPMTVLELLATAFFSSQYISFFVVALSYTNLETAFLLSNCHSMLIIVWRLLRGNPVTLFEGAGVFLGLSGAAVASLDKEKPPVHGANGVLELAAGLLSHGLSGSKIPPELQKQLFGAGLSVLSGICGALYITSASRVRQKVEMSVFMWILLLLHCVVYVACLCGLTLLQGHPLDSVMTLDFDTVTGLFGWATPERIYATALCSVIGTILGTCVYVAVMKYLDPIVVSVAMLCEPFMGVISGVMFGQASWPGLWGWLGSSVSVVGAVVVLAGSRNTTKSTTIH